MRLAKLHRDGIPVTVLTDGMAGWLMAQGEISCVVVGADRIARNGDVANKIGTYNRTMAVLNQAPVHPGLCHLPDLDRHDYGHPDRYAHPDRNTHPHP
jgi:hypothetical protein